MRILLTIPTDVSSSHKESVIPLGIAYINGSLRENGFDVISCNLNYVKGDVSDFLENIITSNNIDIFMCGGTSYHYHSMRDLFDIVKRIKPQIITIGGGVGYTSQPYLFPQMTNPDYVVLGEGEETTCELIRTLENDGDVSCVRGIMYKLGNEYIKTPERSLIKNINDIPFPSYEGFCIDEFFADLNDYTESMHYDYETSQNPRVLPILFGRSCPYDCKFCFHTIGRAYRARSFDNFFEELDTLVEKYSITGVTIMDEFFGVNRKTIWEFCERISEYSLKWFAELRVDAVDRELLVKMKESGCTNVLYGLESMNSMILKDMNKRITVEQIKKALSDSYEVGLTISGNFIVGTPLETMETFYETFDWWNRHRKYQIDFVYLQLYPGTEYYRQAIERGLILDEELFVDSKMPEINISQMNSYEWDKARRFVRLTRIDNVMNGKFEIKSENGEKTLLLTCRRCGANHSQPFANKIWTQLTHKCPDCGHKTTYAFNEKNNRLFVDEIYKQYALNAAYGYSMSEWFLEKGYEKVALVGNGYNLILMIEELKKNNKQIVAISDFDLKTIRMYENTVFTENIVEIEDLSKLDGVDVVILCSTIEYARQVALLRQMGYTGRIDSMTNAILNHDYFIEENVPR